MIKEGDKVKLKSGYVAMIDEVLEAGVMYIGGIYKKDGLTIDHIAHDEIASVYVENEVSIEQYASA